MKYSIAFIVAAAAATVTAQLPGLPDCASECVSKISSFGTCGSSNFKCICADQGFIAGISQCVQKVCSADDQKKTMELAINLCSSAGAPIPSSVISSFIAGASASATSHASGYSASATSPASGLSTSGTAATATQTAAAGKIGVSGLGLGAAAAALFLL